MTRQPIIPSPILITGATDGLGLALAHYYRPQAERLVLVGRRPFAEVPLADFGPDSYCRVDLARPDCAQQVEQWLAARNIDRLELVIHNAGTGYYGDLANQSPEGIRTILAVNLEAPIALTHTLWPRVERAGGKFVFISSVVSVLPGPKYAVYGASKAALDGFVRNLQLERHPGVRLQLIHPGATRTGMHAKSGIRRAEMDWERFPPAKTVATQIAQAIASDRPAVTIGWSNRLLQLAGRYASGLVDRAMHWRQRG